MRKFLKKSILWFFIILTTVFLIVLFVINTYHKDYFQMTKGTDKKTFLMADSHGLKINLNEINADNLSYASNSYVDIKNQLSWIVNNKKVHRVFLSYDEQLFSSYRDNLNINYLSFIYDPLKFSEFKVSYVEKYLNIFQRAFRINIKEKIFFSKKLGEKKLSPESFVNLSKQEKIRRSRSRIEQQYKKESLTQKYAFNDIIDICKENNIDLLLIKFPLSEEFIKERSKNANYNYIKKTNYNFPLLDFSNSILDSKFYRDQDHLNEEGLKILEKLIIEKINHML